MEKFKKWLSVFVKKANEVVNPIVGWCVFGGTLTLAIIIGLIVCL